MICRNRDSLDQANATIQMTFFCWHLVSTHVVCRLSNLSHFVTIAAWFFTLILRLDFSCCFFLNRKSLFTIFFPNINRSSSCANVYAREQFPRWRKTIYRSAILSLHKWEDIHFGPASLLKSDGRFESYFLAATIGIFYIYIHFIPNEYCRK